MVNPISALESFQEEFLQGNIKLQRGARFPDLHVNLQMFTDESFRITYVRFEGKRVIAFVNFVPCQQIGSIGCVQIGYAVPETYRNRGLAKETINMSISELQHGWRRAGITKFYVEAIVEAENKPSQHVARQVISANPVEMTDEVSGLPAFQYLRLVE